jgi:hypothetical protein
MARGKKAGTEAKAAAAGPKKLSPEDQFSELAESVIADADSIKCSIDEQIEGYETLRDAIAERLSSLRKERSREIDGDEDDDSTGFEDDDDDFDLSDDDGENEADGDDF